jgi:hypothetical protein
MKIEFKSNDGEIRHSCQSKQDGDWIVFTCPICRDYERRLNFKTGQMKTRTGENPDALHIGTFQPPGFISEIPISDN